MTRAGPRDSPRLTGSPAGSGTVLLAGVAVEPVELVLVDRAQCPRGEGALEEAADAARALPGAGDLHQRDAALLGRDLEPGDQARIAVGFGEDPAWLRLVHLHPVLAGPAAGRHREPRDRPGPDAAGLDLEVRELRRKELRVVLPHVPDVPEHGVGGCVDGLLGGNDDGCHAGISITLRPGPGRGLARPRMISAAPDSRGRRRRVILSKAGPKPRCTA